MRGYFGIGIENTKNKMNIGTLWRSAHSFNAAFMFTIGRRYQRQASDTTKAWRSVPFFEFVSFEHFRSELPRECMLIGIEIDDQAWAINNFVHPERAVYLLGAEDWGLSKRAKEKCHRIIYLPGRYCLNVATAGSIVMYDRILKGQEILACIPSQAARQKGETSKTSMA